MIMDDKEIEDIFFKHFERNMYNKDFKGFKRAFNTLYDKVVVPAMKEAYNKGENEFLTGIVTKN